MLPLSPVSPRAGRAGGAVGGVGGRSEGLPRCGWAGASGKERLVEGSGICMTGWVSCVACAACMAGGIMSISIGVGAVGPGVASALSRLAFDLVLMTCVPLIAWEDL